MAETSGFCRGNRWFPSRQPMVSFTATIGTRQGEQCIPPERTTVSAVATALGAMVLDSKNRAFLVENGLFSQKIYHSITKSVIKYLAV